MYKNFKQSFEAETNLIVTRSLSNLSVLSQNAANEKREEEKEAGLRCDSDLTNSPDPDVLDTVKACWENVSGQCVEYSRRKIYSDTGSKSGWQTVRLFVSSTFTDFFWEREILVKKVFPELREWCKVRQLYLVECDLRWGVVKDTAAADTILICLEELDRCLEETGGKAFFLNMLGERYGWIPPETDVPAHVREKYDWVPGTSITFMEILHGAFRLKNPNALFMLRDKSLLDDIPEGQRSRFKDSDDLSVEHLKQLKMWLQSRFSDQVQSYKARVEGTVTKHSREMVKVGELDGFADSVLNFFKNAIDLHFPGRGNNQIWESVVLQEEANQKKVMEEKAGSVLSRARESSLVVKFIEGETTGLTHEGGQKPFARKPEYWSDMSTSSNVPLCVLGPSGFGKSTMLAGVVQDLAKNKKCNLFYHFCGETAYSSNVEVLLQRLIAFFCQDFSHDHLSSLQAEDENTLRSRWLKEIKAFRSKEDNQLTVIVVDALDQLSTSNYIDHLSWLPPTFPDGVKCMLSTTPHPATVARVKEHANFILELEPLTKEDSRNIICSLLGKYSKKLDTDQQEILLRSESSQNPLWLQLMCEELRIYGDFRTLSSQIKTMSVSLDATIETILARLLTEDDTGLSQKALSIVVCGLRPITAIALRHMLGDMENREPIPSLQWAQLERHLHLVLQTKNSNDELYFVHNKVKMVIYDSLIKSVVDRRKLSELYADYIENCDDSSGGRIKEDLPHYLLDAQLYPRLVIYMRNLADSTKLPSFRRSEFMRGIRCKSLADPVIKNVAPVYICMFCKMKKAAFFPSAMHRNMDMCVVCGVHVFGPQSQVKGHLCTHHALRAGSHQIKCFLCCNLVTDTKQAVAGKLCLNCGFGNWGKQCVSIEPYKTKAAEILSARK